MKKFFKKALWYGFGALALIGVGMAIAGTIWEQTIVVEAAEEKIIDKTPEKVAALKASVVDRLLSCESAGHAEDDAIIMYDNNQAGTLKGKNVFSLGQLQYKVSTIQHYEKLRSNSILTQKEAVLVALDTDKARELATWIIFETDGGWKNWFNCMNSKNLVAEIAVINKFAK